MESRERSTIPSRENRTYSSEVRPCLQRAAFWPALHRLSNLSFPFGWLAANMFAVSELKILIPRDKIAQRVAEMGAEITRDFQGETIIFVGVLKGAAIFLSDLARQVTLDATFDFIGVSSYGSRANNNQEVKGGWDSTGEVRLTKDVDNAMVKRNVILVEDILDTGLTLTYLQRVMMAHQPKSLKIAALLDKPSRRKKPIKADYVGFTIPDEFVVGYGLDHAERYRNLPDICVLPTGG